VGFVSATAWSPRLEENIALAMVLRKFEAGDGLEVDLDGEHRKAKVTGLPFA
jgi:glycine cleavage system aminomethyltransferase T